MNFKRFKKIGVLLAATVLGAVLLPVAVMTPQQVTKRI